MPSVDLLSVFAQEADLDNFAKAFFDVAQLLDYEERESSSHVEGRYFRAVHGEFSFLVAKSDELDHEDLPYWIQITNGVLEIEDLVCFADQLVRNVMIPAGFRVARVTDLGRRDEQRVDY